MARGDKLIGNYSSFHLIGTKNADRLPRITPIEEASLNQGAVATNSGAARPTL